MKKIIIINQSNSNRLINTENERVIDSWFESNILAVVFYTQVSTNVYNSQVILK